MGKRFDSFREIAFALNTTLNKAVIPLRETL